MNWRGPFLLLFVLFAGWATWYVIQPTQADLVASRAGPAALIQAIWSVVAVILAVIAPQWHADVQSRADYARQRRLLAEIVIAVESALRTAAACGNDPVAAATFGNAVKIGQWNSIRDSIAAFPVTALRTAAEVTDLMEVRSLIAESIETLKMTRRMAYAWNGATDQIRRGLEDAMPAIKRLERGP